MDQAHCPDSKDAIAIMALIMAQAKLSLLDVKKFIFSP
jgi:hypothetical protein